MSDLSAQWLGQYQIVTRIGRGSTSTIYKAYQPKLDRFVAVKILSPYMIDEEGFRERFMQEAHAIARLDHPNIVPVYDFDQAGDISYIVLKYVQGGTLRQMMTGTPMDLGLALEILTQIGQALSYAHKHGVLHRDIKPGNILIGEGRWVMLTDFGLSKILNGGQHLTRAGAWMGTPGYMAPELWQGAQVDGRTDLYALGVMLYEMLTGRLPFEGNNSVSLVIRHLQEAPSSPRQFNPGLPEAVEKVILKALEKDPRNRFQTVEEMVDALVQAVGPSQNRIAMPIAVIAPRQRPAAWKALDLRLREASRQIRVWGMNTCKWFTTAGLQANAIPWEKLSSSRGRLAGIGLTGIMLLLFIGSLLLTRPATGASPSSTAVTLELSAVEPTEILPIATSTPTAVPPTATPAVVPPTATSMPTPEWTFLPSSAPIQPGIYVQVVKPSGLDVFVGAGFSQDFITTLPAGKILYVLSGSSRADSLTWIRVTDGAVVGWGVQDHITAYGIRNVP